MKTVFTGLALAVLLTLAAVANPGTAQGQTASTPPGTAGVQVTNGTNPGEVNFLWKPATAAAFYRVAWLAAKDFADNRDDGGWRSYIRYSDVTASSSWTLDRLTPGIRYYFIVGAKPRDGHIGWSRWQTLRLNPDTTAVPTDVSLSPSSADPTTAVVGWNPPDTRSAAWYLVGWGKHTDPRQGLRYADVEASISGGRQEHSVTGLEPGVAYIFTVASKGTLHGTTSSPATVTHTMPLTPPASSSTTFEFTFEDDAQGWTVGFADLPVDYDQSIYELEHGHRPLPDGLQGHGIYVQGHNRSDDLFMFLTRQVDGLTPDATYAVSVSVDLAANIPAVTFGIGGSPGTSVYVKAGASTEKPETVVDQNQYFRMNIDKGNQSRGGTDMAVLGNVANPEVTENEYRIKTLETPERHLTVTADGEGTVWLIAGTDSGFEGLSAFYYDRITYVLSPVENPNVRHWRP